jgi:hypothetical protein
MAEWPIAVVLKTTDSQESGGSNPSPTVSLIPILLPVLARTHGARFSVPPPLAAERWQSGRSRRLAKALTGVTPSGGSNPPLSASFLRTRFLVAAALMATACAGPTLTLRAIPGDAVVYLDNRQVPPEAPRVRPLPYYGTLRIEAEHRDRMPAARRITVAEPVTPWVFPFDFVIELIGRLGGPSDVRVELPLPAADSAPPAPLPPKELLRARAAAAAVRR